MTPTKIVYSVIDSILSLVRVLLLSKWGLRYPQKSSDTLIVLGNGPSLKMFDMAEKNWNEDILAVNQFASTSMFVMFKPKFYVIAAPEYWLDNVDHEYVESRVLVFSAIRKLLSWNMTFFIPFGSKKFRFKEYLEGLNPLIKVYYFNSTPIEGLTGISHVLFNLRLGIPRPHNVLIPSILLGIWMQYKFVYLLGAEHSWLSTIVVDENNVAMLEQKHFYDKGQTTKTSMRKLGRGQRKLHEILEKFYISFRAYHTISDFAIKKEVKIYNATKNSFIDAFERKLLS